MADDNSRPVADNFARRFAPPELYDPKKRREWKLGRHDKDRGPYVIELNLQHIEGLSGAVAALDRLLKAELPSDPTKRLPEADYITKTYARVMLTVEEWKSLLKNDEKQAEALAHEATARQTYLQASGKSIDSMRYRAIYKLWPDFPVYSQIYRSVATIKSDAAVRSYGAGGSGIVWAVIDSGIDGDHPHFDTRKWPHAPLTGRAGPASVFRRQRRDRCRAWTFPSWSLRPVIRMRCRGQPRLASRQEQQKFRDDRRPGSWTTIDAWR